MVIHLEQVISPEKERKIGKIGDMRSAWTRLRGMAGYGCWSSRIYRYVLGFGVYLGYLCVCVCS